MKRSLALSWPLALLSLLAFPGSSVLGAAAAAPPPPVAGAPPPPAAGACLVYAGTYTGPQSKGIYGWTLDTATGSVASAGLAGETTSPSFIEIAPNHRFLFAVNEVDSFQGKPAGSVTAFSIDAATGKLTLLNQQTSGGRGPCYLTVDSASKNVLVANYNGGSIECLPIQSDGQIGAPTAFIQHTGKSIVAGRQDGPHAHCIVLDPAGQFALVCDLGLDKIMSYRFDAGKGTLTANQPAFTAAKPGAGPRHLVFAPDGRQAYVINEINSTIARYSYDAAKGVLTELQTVSTLPPGFTGVNTAAEIAVHPSGKYLYGSNRGDDSIAVFSIDAASGALTFLQRIPAGGKTPRNISMDPFGKLLFSANQGSGNIVIFNLDPATGMLAASGKVLQAASPVCVKFLPLQAPQK
jgi:6-phosphogluconolactonase